MSKTNGQGLLTLTSYHQVTREVLVDKRNSEQEIQMRQVKQGGKGQTQPTGARLAWNMDTIEGHGGPKGTTKKGGTYKKSKATVGNGSQTTAGNGSQFTAGNESQAPNARNMNPDELEELLNDDDILDIPPLRIDTSPAKNNMPGPKTFIGKFPKVSNPVKPAVNPTMSDPVKIMISPRKKSKNVASPIRKSDRFGTLKTKNMEGPGRDPNDPFVIPEEDSTIGTSRGNEKWDDIQKSVTQ
ncbi:unnamed protein product [Vicia faba]|uniref:Uncharacterized protein n=1 Tax=Vicia faba TaxID=3906 RepID=A0AAV1AMG2_VICFA|nr:unnamed protein product [Vicia faba]